MIIIIFFFCYNADELKTVLIWESLMKVMSQRLFQKCIRRFVIRSRRHEVGYLSWPFVLEFGRRLSTFSTCKISKRCGYFNTQSHKFGTLRDLKIRRFIWYQIIAFAQLYVNANLLCFLSFSRLTCVSLFAVQYYEPCPKNKTLFTPMNCEFEIYPEDILRELPPPKINRSGWRAFYEFLI